MYIFNTLIYIIYIYYFLLTINKCYVIIIVSVAAKVTHLMSVPTVLLNSIATVITATAMGYYSATLEPHIRGVSTYIFLKNPKYCNNKNKSI